MNELTVFFLAFLVVGTGLQFWLTRRHRAYVASHKDAVPEAFAERISLEAHRKAATYTLTKTGFGQKMLMVEFVVLLLWTLGGLLNVLDDAWRNLGWSPLWTGVVMLISFDLLSKLIDLPAEVYSTFRIEAQFGFNRTTPTVFITDLVKELVLSLAIGIPFAALVLWLMASAGEFWWLYVWAVSMAFLLLMLWAFPIFIAPLFNKFKPLEDEELKQRIEVLLQRNGFASQGIFVMDGSKRSGHGNAYFTGLGNSKRVVFYDTLLEGLNTDEIEAVLAHEIGHFKCKHLRKRMIVMAISSLAGLALLGWLMQQQWFYTGLGVNTPSIYMALLLFMLVLPVFTFFLAPVMAWFSRKHEFEADNFAAEQGSASALIQALVKLYRENANTLTPDPLYSAFFHSHPPAPVRIAHLSEKV